MKRILPLIIVSALVLAVSACIFYPSDLRVYYEKGSSTGGFVPVDTTKYKYGETVVILGKGDLENEDYEFLGWMFEGQLYKPGQKLYFYYYEDIYFTAMWNDGLGTPFEFEIIGDEAAVIKYTGHNYSYIAIPSSYLGKPVTSIANSVFRNKNIYGAELPKSLKKIGALAFSGCDISNLLIPDSVVTIGPGAFQDNYLLEVIFGKGLTLISEGAFSGNKIQEVNLPDNITTIANNAFLDNNIGYIVTGANVNIESDTSFGTYGASFKKFYEDGGSRAGEYGRVADTWQFFD